MRFISILFAVIFVFTASLLSARFWGLSLQYQAYEHPFLKDLPKLGVKVSTMAELDEALKLSSTNLIWLDLRQTKDNRFLVLSDSATENILTFETVGAELFHGNKPSFYDLAFLRKFFTEAPLLEDVINKAPNVRFVFNIVDSVLDVDKNMIAFIEKHKLSNKVMVQSTAHVVITSIKSERPTWIFGSSQTDWVKMMSFASAYILPASQFNGDVLVMPLTLKDRDMLTDELTKEMQRRFKKVFAGPLTDKSQLEKAKSMQPDVYVLSNLELLRAASAEMNSK